MTSSESRGDCQEWVSPEQIIWQPPDMTATFGASVAWQQVCGDGALWLPIDCQGEPDQRIGRLVEMNSSGPLRLGFGGWRDLLLGCQFRNGSGQLITAGGRTVKNVAGYDLTKFMVGQSGVFGRVVAVTTRLYLKPEDAILTEFAPEMEIFNRLIASPCRPQWAVLNEQALFCGYLGNLRTIEYYAAELPAWQPKRMERHGFNADMEWRSRHWRRPEGSGYSMRASLPPMKMQAFARESGLAGWVADPAFGIVLGRVNADAVKKVSEAALACGGRAWFWSGGDEETLVSFSASPGEREILRRLKLTFDPQNQIVRLPSPACVGSP
jgi:hypothetical protein